MKGESIVINGDDWTIVDVAPAAPLAEMVAGILEEEGFVVLVRGAELLGDVFTHLGSTSAATSYVLVPEKDAGRALALIEETVTDFEGEELEELLRRMESGELEAGLSSGDLDEELEDGEADDEDAERAPARAHEPNGEPGDDGGAPPVNLG